MMQIAFCLLTLLFSMGSPAMEENADFWQSTLAARGVPALRQGYVDAVTGLAGKVPGMRQAGMSSEQIARTLSAERNALKVQFRALSPPEAVNAFEARNLAKYGDRLGPSADQLQAAGKTWEQIIEGATRPGGADLGF